jgi:SAM-dependent methyltransferase
MTYNLPGVHTAPNIQSAPDIYEIENLAADPEQYIETAMWGIAPWENKTVLDLGAGTGFHASHFHEKAAHVFLMEPHNESRLKAMARIVALNLQQASVLTGSAEKILLPDGSMDVIHARFAYFFAPHCEPGLFEVARVLRPGGTAFIIDNDLRNGTFAHWLKRHPNYHDVTADVVENFWRDRGYDLLRIPSRWQFQTRADLEAVVKLEFGERLGSDLLREHDSLHVDYHYCLYYRQYR